jgi:sterol desaturase/sphingolipid hydroxylase (fatty acid hydroxylase superfamily)
MEQYEPVIRLSIFVGVLVLLGVAETVWPRRKAYTPRLRRWITNLLMLATGTLLLRALLPLLAVGWALYVDQRGWGLFNQLSWPLWLELPVTVLLFDLVIYGQHRLMHWLPPLWRLHRVHHSDLDFDASTGLRFHPVEIVFSMLIKLTLVMLLGATAIAVLVFEVLLNATSLFEHANLRIPQWVDRWLRYVVVTPDMHRVHHSWHREETDSNFGFNFPWWDRIFLSYRAQPRDGHLGMTIGLTQYRKAEEQSLTRLLLQPLSKD